MACVLEDDSLFTYQEKRRMTAAVATAVLLALVGSPSPFTQDETIGSNNAGR